MNTTHYRLEFHRIDGDCIVTLDSLSPFLPLRVGDDISLMPSDGRFVIRDIRHFLGPLEEGVILHSLLIRVEELVPED